MAIAVRITSTVIDTVKIAEVASSSRRSMLSTNSGTKVADSTPPEDQLVDDVGRGVREVVGVGEGRAADRVGEHGDPQQAGDPRQEGPGPDRRAGSDEPGLLRGGSRLCGARHGAAAAARRRARRDRQMWLPHQPARNTSAPRVSAIPIPLNTADRIVTRVGAPRVSEPSADSSVIVMAKVPDARAITGNVAGAGAVQWPDGAASSRRRCPWGRSASGSRGARGRGCWRGRCCSGSSAAGSPAARSA